MFLGPPLGFVEYYRYHTDPIPQESRKVEKRFG
jgi:hypothetical protein